MKIIRGFFCTLALLVLIVLYGGLIVSALIALLASILRTLGVDQIKMSVWQGIDVPVAFSIPFALIISSILFYCSRHVKRAMSFCFSTLSN
ncbi:hypothetical protein ACIQXI_17715 [Lysinibacillus sp. NPDC097195]|uniref:hypothetical protein n=1 Tax=Lysinibacillus sp. NPDC097195 TaxID=3364141 RepID=UPI00382A366F